MSRIRGGRLLLAGAVASLAIGATGCGGGSESAAAELPSTGADEAFTVTSGADGEQLVSGHGLAFTMPQGWGPFSEEVEDTQAFSVEYVAPSGEPFPAFFNFTVGRQEESEGRVREAATAAQGVAEVSEEGYELVDEGEVEVPGAETAYELRFKRVLNLASGGQSYPAEQLMLFFQTPDKRVVTVRFIAPEGKLEETGLMDVRESMMVNVEE